MGIPLDDAAAIPEPGDLAIGGHGPVFTLIESTLPSEMIMKAGEDQRLVVQV